MKWSEEAAKVYLRESCPRSFLQDLSLHKMSGYVIDTDRYFAMGRAVPRDAPECDLLNPAKRYRESECDAWLVWLVAGDMRAAWECFPRKFEWIGFQRQNDLRWWKMDRMASIIVGTT